MAYQQIGSLPAYLSTGAQGDYGKYLGNQKWYKNRRPDLFTYPAGSTRIKPAEWIAGPPDAQGNVQIGLGRYRKYRRAPRRGAYAPKVINVFKRAARVPKRRAVKRRAYRRTRYGGRRSYRTGRGGFWDAIKSLGQDAWSGLKQLGGHVYDSGRDVLKQVGGEVLSAGRDILREAAPGIKAAALAGLQGITPMAIQGMKDVVKHLTGRGAYHSTSPWGNVPVLAGRGAYSGANQDAAALMQYAAAMDGAQDSDDDQGGGDGAVSSSPMGYSRGQLFKPGYQPTGGGQQAQSDLMTAQGMRQDMPTFINSGEGTITVVHREYLADIVSTGSAFQLVANLKINPGLSPENGGAFPWLSGIAAHFTNYRFNGLTFEYRSTSGNFSAQQGLGEVIVSTQYNVQAPAPTNKAQMLNTTFAISRVPSVDFTHPIECNRQVTMLNGKFLVRTGALDQSENQTFYDTCETNIAVQGQTLLPGGASANIILGELWVSYACSFWNPTIPSAMPQTNDDTSFTYDSGTLVSAPVVLDMFAYTASRNLQSQKVYDGTNGAITVNSKAGVVPVARSGLQPNGLVAGSALPPNGIYFGPNIQQRFRVTIWWARTIAGNGGAPGIGTQLDGFCFAPAFWDNTHINLFSNSSLLPGYKQDLTGSALLALQTIATAQGFVSSASAYDDRAGQTPNFDLNVADQYWTSYDIAVDTVGLQARDYAYLTFIPYRFAHEKNDGTGAIDTSVVTSGPIGVSTPKVGQISITVTAISQAEVTALAADTWNGI